MKYKQYNHSCGAKILYVKNRLNHSTNINIQFNGGAMKEKISGLAHLTEHMFFAGTDSLDKKAISKKYFDFISVNAITTIRNIVFMGNIFTEELTAYIDTVVEMITKSTFDTKRINEEKKVVYQEMKQNVDDYSYMSNLTDSSMIYGHDFINNSVIGNKQSVSKIKREDILDFVRSFFVANNAEIVICTPLSLSKVKRIMNDHLIKALPSVDNFEPIGIQMYESKDFNYYQVKYKDIDKVYLYFSFKFDSNMYDLDTVYKANTIKYMLNNYSTGLNKMLRLDRHLVYSCAFMTTFMKETALIRLETECEKKNVNEVIKVVAEYINNIKEKGFTAEELKYAKRIYRHSETTKVDTIKRVMNKLIEYDYFGKIVDSKKYMKIALDTDLDEYNRLARDIFNFKNVGITVYGNIKKSEALKQSEIDRLFTKRKS